MATKSRGAGSGGCFASGRFLASDDTEALKKSLQKTLGCKQSKIGIGQTHPDFCTVALSRKLRGFRY